MRGDFEIACGQHKAIHSFTQLLLVENLLGASTTLGNSLHSSCLSISEWVSQHLLTGQAPKASVSTPYKMLDKLVSPIL